MWIFWKEVRCELCGYLGSQAEKTSRGDVASGISATPKGARAGAEGTGRGDDVTEVRPRVRTLDSVQG